MYEGFVEVSLILCPLSVARVTSQQARIFVERKRFKAAEVYYNQALVAILIMGLVASAIMIFIWKMMFEPVGGADLVKYCVAT